MNESTDIPAAADGMPPASAGDAGAQASTSADGASVPGTASSADQIRRDPEKAERMLREFQGKADRAQAELEKFGPVKQLLDGGMTTDQLVQSAQQVNWINSRPEVLAAIQGALNGTPAAPSTPERTTALPDDDLLTDEERAMKSEMAELRAQVQALQGRTAQTETSFSMQAVKTNLASVANQLGLPPAVRDRVERDVSTHITQLGAKHQSGDPTALNALQNLTGPNAAEAMRTMVQATLKVDDFDEIAQHRALRRSQGVEALRTDGLPGVATTGTEPPPDFATVEEAMEWSLKNPNAHDSW